MDEEERIQANAELAIQHLAPLSDVAFGYNAESVEWLEGYIERLRASGKDDSRLVSVLGSFLGECIIRCHGGRWEKRDGEWAVAFDDRNVAFPFAKVAKQMQNGAAEGGDGISGFFAVIPVVFADPLRSWKPKA